MHFVFGSVLEPLWAVPNRFGGVLGRLRDVYWKVRKVPDSHMRRPGAAWTPHRAPGAVLGRSWMPLRAVLGRLGGVFKASWALPEASESFPGLSLKGVVPSCRWSWPHKPQWPQDCPKRVQEAPPRAAEDRPKPLPRRSKTSQEQPETANIAPKSGPETAQDRLQRPWERPRTTHRGLESGSGHSQRP